MVKGSSYGAEMFFIHEKEANSILPKSGLIHLVAVTQSIIVKYIRTRLPSQTHTHYDEYKATYFISASDQTCQCVSFDTHLMLCYQSQHSVLNPFKTLKRRNIKYRRLGQYLQKCISKCKQIYPNLPCSQIIMFYSKIR